MINKIKELRVEIDGLSQLVRGLKEDSNKESKFPFNSPECSKSYDSLILAKAWLGKILQELDVPTPYKNDGKRKTVEDIEPTADKAAYIKTNTVIGMKDSEGNVHTLNSDKIYGQKSHIEKVDWLREEIQKVLQEQADVKAGLISYLKDFYGWKYIYQHLSEARFWLGFELGRIKDTQ